MRKEAFLLIAIMALSILPAVSFVKFSEAYNPSLPYYFWNCKDHTENLTGVSADMASFAVDLPQQSYWYVPHLSIGVEDLGNSVINACIEVQYYPNTDSAQTLNINVCDNTTWDTGVYQNSTFTYGFHNINVTETTTGTWKVYIDGQNKYTYTFATAMNKANYVDTGLESKYNISRTDNEWVMQLMETTNVKEKNSSGTWNAWPNPSVSDVQETCDTWDIQGVLDTSKTFLAYFKSPTYTNAHTYLSDVYALGGVTCVCDWNDPFGLSGFILSSNATGQWTNNSWVPLSGTYAEVRDVFRHNNTVGSQDMWLFYANDSYNYWAVSPLGRVEVTSSSEWNRFLTHEQMILVWQNLWKSHGLGSDYWSVGQTYDGNDIWMFTCGNTSGTPSLWDAQMHGDEELGAENLYYAVNWLLNGSTDANYALSKCKYMFIPVVDYDTNAVNNRTNAQFYPESTNATNLNRNFATNWIHQGMNLDSYSGPNASSEPETQVIQSVLEEYHPVFYTNLHEGIGPFAKFYDPIGQDGNQSCFQFEDDYLNTINTIADNMGISSNMYPIDWYDDSTIHGYAVGDAYSVYHAPSAMLIETQATWNYNLTTFNDVINKYSLNIEAILQAQANKTNALYHPVFGMKTKNDGFFMYWPNANTSGSIKYVKVEETFTDVNAGGNNWGKNVTGYSFEFPDDKVDGKDIAHEAMYFGACESDPDNPTHPWTNATYMADIDHSGSSARSIDGKDVAYTALHFGQGDSNWYDTSMTYIYVKFYCNSGNYSVVVLVDSNGWAKVPVDSGEIDLFRTYRTPQMQLLGALVTFWG